MLRLLADENLNFDIVRGLLLRDPNLDLVRIQDLAMDGESDPNVLAWAAENDRIVLTYDRSTMPGFAYARLAANATMPGVFVIKPQLTVGQAIDEILLLDACSNQVEWLGRVIHLPL